MITGPIIAVIDVIIAVIAAKVKSVLMVLAEVETKRGILLKHKFTKYF